MSNDARAAILQKIRAATQPLQSQELPQPRTWQRPVFNETLVDKFALQLAKVAGQFQTVKNIAEALVFIQNYLQQQQFNLNILVDKSCKELPWAENAPAVQLEFRAPVSQDKVSVTRAFAGIAETGSIVMLSSPDSPTPLHFLPDLHIVLLAQTGLVRHIENVWEKIALMPIPRAINLITGPSRTADIEQTIQLGAHGPRTLLVIHIEEL